MSARHHYDMLPWTPIDDVARDGRCQLVRQGNNMAVARWNGDAFVFPATGNRPLDFEPSHYYVPPGVCVSDNGRAFASKRITGGANSLFRFKPDERGAHGQA